MLAIKRELCTSCFTNSLDKKHPKSYLELPTRAQKYIHADEAYHTQRELDGKSQKKQTREELSEV